MSAANPASLYTLRPSCRLTPKESRPSRSRRQPLPGAEQQREAVPHAAAGGSGLPLQAPAAAPAGAAPGLEPFPTLPQERSCPARRGCGGSSRHWGRRTGAGR